MNTPGVPLVSQLRTMCEEEGVEEYKTVPALFMAENAGKVPIAPVYRKQNWLPSSTLHSVSLSEKTNTETSSLDLKSTNPLTTKLKSAPW